MHRLSTLLALIPGLVHAQLLPMNLPFRRTESSLPEGNTSPVLFLRQTATDCAQDTNSCDSGCIPEDGECCDTGDGGWCGAGTSCQSDGCCPEGEDCSGPATSCGAELVFCGTKCMPEGAVCCLGESYFCGSGATCTDGGLCSDGTDSPGCGNDEESCGSGCIPSGQVCCETYHCPLRYTCGDADFECASSSNDRGGTEGDGDDSEMCVGDFEACGSSCMPKGGTCCDGFFCGVGEKCARGRKCEVADEEGTEDGEAGDDDDGGESDGDGGPTGSPSPTDNDEPDGALRLTAVRGPLLTFVLALIPLIF